MKTKLIKGLFAAGLAANMLVGCGSNDASTNVKDIKKVAIIQLVEHTSLNTIKSSFDKQMKELGYEEGKNILIWFF